MPSRDWCRGSTCFRVNVLVKWYGLTVIIEIITAVSGISVVLSLLFAGMQTRELAKQTKLNNHIGSLASMHDSLEMLREIQIIFTEKPELRPYFYAGKSCPGRGRRREVVINIAEMFADAIDYGLMVVKLMPGTQEYEGWYHYARFMAQNSPTLNEHLRENPEWYLGYWQLITANDSARPRRPVR
jgi:hypothetical protein